MKTNETRTIKVKANASLARDIASMCIRSWSTTSYPNGRRHVTVRFEETTALGRIG